MNTNLKTEETKAGLKIYHRYDETSPWFHIKTVKCKYEPVIVDLNWIRDYKKILPIKEERLYLEMKYQIWSIEWANAGQRELVNKQDVVCIKRIEPRGGTTYFVIVMSGGTEVMCSRAAYTVAVNYGIEVQTVKRLQ